MERHGVYPVMQPNGSALATLEGNLLYYGPVPKGNSIAMIRGEWITIGTCSSSGYSDYRLVGNNVYPGSSGVTVFTIRGNYIYDGVGATPFLFCPTGNRMALAAAACCFIGDMRTRLQGTNPVDKSHFESHLSPNITNNRHDYTKSDPSTADRFYGKTSEAERQYGGGRNWSPTASHNFDQARRPVGIGREDGGVKMPESYYRNKMLDAMRPVVEQSQPKKESVSVFDELRKIQESQHHFTDEDCGFTGPESRGFGGPSPEDVASKQKKFAEKLAKKLDEKRKELRPKIFPEYIFIMTLWLVSVIILIGIFYLPEPWNSISYALLPMVAFFGLIAVPWYHHKMSFWLEIYKKEIIEECTRY